MRRPEGFEAAFAAALLAEEGTPPPGLRDPGRNGARRFAVYRNTVAASLVRALGASFPAVEALVGEAFFRGLALLFLRAHPPRSPVLHEWGAAFPDFIAAFPPAAALPYLADVARLDRAALRAFHAADAEPAGLEALAAVPPEALAGLRILPHPAAALVASPHPVVALRAEATGGRADLPVDLARAESALVTRPGLSVEVVALSPGAAALAAALLQGATFGEAAERALAHPGTDLPAAIGAVFGAGIAAGFA